MFLCDDAIVITLVPIFPTGPFENKSTMLTTIVINRKILQLNQWKNFFLLTSITFVASIVVNDFVEVEVAVKFSFSIAYYFNS